MKESKDLERLWQEYQKKNTYANNIFFDDVIKSIETIINILQKELVLI